MLYRALILGGGASIALSVVFAASVDLDRATAATDDKADSTVIDFTYGNGLDAAARALDRLLGGLPPFCAAILEQAPGSLRRVRHFEQILRHTHLAARDYHVFP